MLRHEPSWCIMYSLCNLEYFGKLGAELVSSKELILWGTKRNDKATAVITKPIYISWYYLPSVNFSLMYQESILQVLLEILIHRWLTSAPAVFANAVEYYRVAFCFLLSVIDGVPLYNQLMAIKKAVWLTKSVLRQKARLLVGGAQGQGKRPQKTKTPHSLGIIWPDHRPQMHVLGRGRTKRVKLYFIICGWLFHYNSGPR